MLDIVLILGVFSALLVLTALSQPIAARLRVAPVVLLAVIGVAISLASNLLASMPMTGRLADIERLFVDLPLSSEVFIYVFVPLLVFEGALTSDVRRILEDAAPILMLAVVATLAAAGIVGLALWPIAGLPLVVCLLLGAVVSTTDPAAVIAIFREVGTPGRLTRLVAGEALLNDAAAIVLYSILLGMIVSGTAPVLGAGALQFLDRLPRRGGARLRGRPGVPFSHPLDRRRPLGRGHADGRGRVSRLYLGGPAVPCLRRRLGSGGGPHDRGVRADAHRALQLGLPHRSLGATRLLGAFARLSSRLDPRAEAAGRPAHSRPSARRRADRRGFRGAPRGALPAPAGAQPRAAHRTHQHGLQARHRLGRPARRADARAGALGYGKHRAAAPGAALRRRAGDGPRPVHAARQWNDTARGHSHSGARPPLAHRPATARPRARALLYRDERSHSRYGARTRIESRGGGASACAPTRRG